MAGRGGGGAAPPSPRPPRCWPPPCPPPAAASICCGGSGTRFSPEQCHGDTLTHNIVHVLTACLGLGQVERGRQLRPLAAGQVALQVKRGLQLEHLNSRMAHNTVHVELSTDVSNGKYNYSKEALITAFSLKKASTMAFTITTKLQDLSGG